MSQEIARRRGAFIVFEGIDRSGKTTQTARLAASLREHYGAERVVEMRFPDRTTPIGSMIDAYLRSEQALSDQAIHLLFSANRWECVARIRSLLADNKIIVCDRYWQSGVAYSYAKGLPMEWCLSCDQGLPQANLTINLHLTCTQAAERDDYGQERYERIEFQERVLDAYDKLCSVIVEVVEYTKIDAAKTPDEVAVEALSMAMTTIAELDSGARVHPPNDFRIHADMGMCRRELEAFDKQFKERLAKDKEDAERGRTIRSVMSL